MNATKTIDSDLLTILRGMSFDGNVAMLNSGQLDRKTYLRTNEVLESLGGKWNRGKKGHTFDGCPEEIIGDAISSGTYVNEKQAFQFYETPDELADELIERADITEQHYILEPSAGHGALIKAIGRRVPGGRKIAAVEVQSNCGKYLRELNCAFVSQDFLTVFPVNGLWIFDRIVMNPPFTRSQDIDHVRHAYKFLRPGGKLVAIMSTGFTFRSDRKAVEFREWLDEVGGEWTANDAGAFKSSGTMVNTVMVTITK